MLLAMNPKGNRHVTATEDKATGRLRTYLGFALGDLAMGRRLDRAFVAALQRWGERRTDDIDCLHAIQLMPVVERDGFTGGDRYSEVARRLERFKRGEPDGKLIRAWLESRKHPGKAAAGQVAGRAAPHARRKVERVAR